MKKNYIANGIVHLVLILLSLACLLPFLMILSASFTSETAIKTSGYGLFPRQFSAEAYRYILRTPSDVIWAYGVTIFVTAVGTAAGTLLMTMLAYPLSRADFKYKNIFSFYVYFTMLFSGGLVPVYLLVANYLKLKDSVWALIVPILMSGWNVFLLRMFLRNIPASLIESAYLEGAGEFRIFFRIVAPLSKIGIVTVGLFTALNYWNDWYQAMLYIDHGRLTSLQYMLYRVMNQVNLAQEYAGTMATTEKLPDENLRMALCVVAAGPMLLVFPFFQKYFSKGIIVGSVKG
jgi:putative aldouronate transport system permease protein